MSNLLSLYLKSLLILAVVAAYMQISSSNLVAGTLARLCQ